MTAVLILTMIPGVVLAQTSAETTSGTTIQEIVTMAINKSPILQRQQEYIDMIRALPQPGEGFIDFDELKAQLADPEGVHLGLSQIAQLENIREMQVKRSETLAQAKITYQNLKKELIGEVMEKITTVNSLANRYHGRSELQDFLQERKTSLEKQVRAGVEQPSTLFDLEERIMNLQVELKNVQEQLRTVKLETALSYGGEWWEDMLVLLDQL